MPTGSLAGCEGGFPGLFDLVGNVYEMVLCDGTLPCAVYGGSWSRADTDCSYTLAWASLSTDVEVGFRCCLDL